MSIISNIGHIKRSSRESIEALLYPRFARIKREGRGLLSPSIYKAIYDTVASAEHGLDLLDIGAAGGASTVAAALQLKNQQSNARVIAVEKCEGGSRHKFGQYKDNLSFLEQNIDRFGVSNYVALFPEYLTFQNADDVIKLIETSEIAGFTHDADGRIDRDFTLFGPMLAKNNFVIIDDYSAKVKFTKISDAHPFGGTKNIVTYRILNYVMELGLFSFDKKLGTTVFGKCPPCADFSEIDLQHCQKIVDEVLREHADWTAKK